MSKPERCSIQLFTQDGCDSCEMIKKSLPKEDIGIEVVNLSSVENAGELAERYNVDNVPMLVCDCDDKDIDILMDVNSIKSFIQSLSANAE